MPLRLNPEELESLARQVLSRLEARVAGSPRQLRGPLAAGSEGPDGD